MKGILEFLVKNNRWAILLVIILLLVGGGLFKIQSNKIKKLDNKYQTEVKLKNALTDTITTYQNKEGQWVTEKLTMQASIKDLLDNKVTLTKNQKRLLDKVKEANKENQVITAALIHANFVIDSLLHGGLVVVDTLNKTVEFIESKNPDIRYDFLAIDIIPYPRGVTPRLLIKNLSLPNEQFIKFQWKDDKKEGYPITFSVNNTNKYVKTYDINSYAIPKLDKIMINPTGWDKVTQWLNKNGKIVGYVAGGVVVGAGGTYLFMK